jgi:hypothetical protein
MAEKEGLQDGEAAVKAFFSPRVLPGDHGAPGAPQKAEAGH